MSKIEQQPEPVGHWFLNKGAPSVGFPVWVKPTPEQIKATEETFGWEWRDKA